MEDVMVSTDVTLIKKAIRGNVDAYGELITLHKEYLYRMAFLNVRNEDIALEIVQETVLKGFRSIKALRRPEAFKSWLTQILIHIASDYYKKNIPYAAVGEFEPPQKESGISFEERMDLQAAIACLPENYRTVIILKYFEVLKQEEIAHIMNLPRGSVSAYLTRARKELRNILKEGYLNE